ncbi:hypothetical protein MASR2M29_22670 [Spirochaetota bacterium]
MEYSNQPSFDMFLHKYEGLFDKHKNTGNYIRIGWINTSLGPMIAGADERAVRFLEFYDRQGIEGQIAMLRANNKLPLLVGSNPLLDILEKELNAYFAGKLKEFTLPLQFPGTAFQEKTWKALRSIAYGTTMSYSDLAKLIGKPKASRAVGRANAGNRIAIIIPCHRVVSADGSLNGYAGGIDRKKALLELERSFIDKNNKL